MRTLHIFLLVLFFLSTLFAGTPIMDGIFDGEAVWGPPKHVADGIPGWADANAKKLYITDDDTYIYFGAEVSAAKWMSWAFIVNTKDGGGSYDSWSRSIDYAHPEGLPDWAPRGSFGGGGDQDNNYAEFNYWNGTAWDGYVGLDQTEFADTISVNHVVDGWIEIRIPKSSMEYPDFGDVQFYITGDHNEHGNFDACPDDDNATDWDMSGNHNILDHYQTGINLNTVPSAVDQPIEPARSFQLIGNFPNPFNPSTKIRFIADRNGKFQLQISNIRGQLLFSEVRNFSAGQNDWKVALSHVDRSLNSGMYLYSITDLSSGQTLHGKMLYIK